MKIAITVTGKDLAGEVDPRFGRAAGFLIVDTETEDVEYVDNAQNLQAAQGAGVQAARSVADAGAEVVLTGHCGPKAFRTLQAAGIKIFVGVSGSAAEALAKFKSGELESAGGADVDGHWM